MKLASAGAAASLAESNKRQFEHWTPGVIPAANTAAYKAKDYEMEPLWKPELSRAGSQAAMVAHKDPTPVEIWKAPETEHGHTAASSALQNRKSPPAITERTVSTDERQKALLAATASMSGGRRRAESAPTAPQTQSSSPWALKAAASSQNAKPASPTLPVRSPSQLSSADAARVQNMAKNNVSRMMYTSNPPVAIEVEERRKQDMLRASAIAMARKMYAIQQAQFDEAKGIHRSQSHYAAHTARRRAQSDALNKPAPQAELPRYENLEEAARRLAHERLSKIHDEHAEYRQYYGQQTPPQQSRFTLRRGRRPTNLRDDSDSDEEQSRQIRAQMSIFQGKLAEVDSKKRQADRDALLAAAHKNVTARMNALDEKVFSETGKTSAQQRELWERQARDRAQRESDERLMNVGKIHIGGGKYLEQSELDAIARARLQPTLDEISEKAEQQRARDEEIRLEQERVKAEQAAEKQRQAEYKAEQKAVAGKLTILLKRTVADIRLDREKAEQRAQKAEEKRVQQEQKHEERRVRTEQNAARRAEKEEKKKSEPAKTRLLPTSLPTFFSKGAVGIGAGAGAGAAAVAEGAGNAAQGGASLLTGTAPATGTAKAEAEDPAAESAETEEAEDEEPTAAADTVHEQVTLDPTEAAYAVAATEAESHKAEEEEDDDKDENEEVGPKDNIIAQPYASTRAPEEPSSPKFLPVTPVSPTSPASPSKRDSKVKTWFKRFRTGSKAENEFGDKTTLPVAGTGSFAPGPDEPIRSMDEDNKPESDSIRDVALAGRSDNETDDMYGGSAKPFGRVSPIHDENHVHTPIPTGEEERARSISPVSQGTSSLSEEPYVIAADVASSKYSGSKRDSGFDQLGTLSDTDSEPRGRKGFRERFLKKVIPGRDKDKPKSALGDPATAMTSAPATDSAVADHFPTEAQDLDEHHANPDPNMLAQTEPIRQKIQEPSTTSTEATATTTVTGATTPALTHTQTNGDDDEDFEEARDTFEEGRLGPAPKFVDMSGATSQGARLVDVGKKSMDGAASEKGSSRFTEEL